MSERPIILFPQPEVANVLGNYSPSGHEASGIPIKNATKTGYALSKDGDGIDLAYPESNTRHEHWKQRGWKRL